MEAKTIAIVIIIVILLSCSSSILGFVGKNWSSGICCCLSCLFLSYIFFSMGGYTLLTM